MFFSNYFKNRFGKFNPISEICSVIKQLIYVIRPKFKPLLRTKCPRRAIQYFTDTRKIQPDVGFIF